MSKDVWKRYEDEKAKIREEERKTGKYLSPGEYHKRIRKIYDGLKI